MTPTLFFVIPCYFDADVLPVTAPIVLQKLNELTKNGSVSENSRIVYVNDGSTDGTWQRIASLCKTDSRFRGVDLAENVGEERALIAGMEFAVLQGADCVITMDSDLQDDIGTTDAMLQQFAKGNELVLGVRSSRAQDSFAERLFSGAFYTAMQLLGTGLVKEHANFRLMSANAVRVLCKHLDRPFYLPALVCSLALPRAVVSHARFPRAAGESGYSFAKKTKLALHAIRCHAELPLLPPLKRAEATPLYQIKETL